MSHAPKMLKLAEIRLIISISHFVTDFGHQFYFRGVFASFLHVHVNATMFFPKKSIFWLVFLSDLGHKNGFLYSCPSSLLFRP